MGRRPSPSSTSWPRAPTSTSPPVGVDRDGFAANIQALCQAGADIIVDDLFDYRETIYPGGRMAQGIQAAVAEGCVYVSAAGKPIEFGDRERQYTPDRAPAPLDDFSTTEDPKGAMSDLSSATCLIAANPDLETFCGSWASPRQVAALAALIMEVGRWRPQRFPGTGPCGSHRGIAPDRSPSPMPFTAALEPIRDPAGNESPEFTQQTVTNRTGEETKPAAGQLSAKTVRQIQSLLSAKVRRTPAQRKLSSQLLEAQRTPPQQKLNPQLQDALRAPLQKPTAAGDLPSPNHGSGRQE